MKTRRLSWILKHFKGSVKIDGQTQHYRSKHTRMAVPKGYVAPFKQKGSFLSERGKRFPTQVKVTCPSY